MFQCIILKIFVEKVRRYRIRMEKCINAYNRRIIKIYKRCGILSRDSLILDKPYSMKKWSGSLKVINIYKIISFTAQAPVRVKV